MRLLTLPEGGAVYHCAHESFAALLSLTLRGKAAVAALGPIYHRDPAADILRPFLRSAEETRWPVDAQTLAHDQIKERARRVRIEAIPAATFLFPDDPDLVELIDWTRSGLLLEVCRARGVMLSRRGLVRVPWRLRGTVTGRFGVEPVRGDGWTFNPLSLGPKDREEIVPNGPGRLISVLDFRAMDLCSMISFVPGLSARYGEAEDLHARTAQLLGISGEPDVCRRMVKEQVFVHAYGGQSTLHDSFEARLPELSWLRDKPHGDGARLVQTQSARAFRAALSRALPLLLGEEVRPMFTVHDELALDHSEECSDRVAMVASAMAEAASQRIGVTYRVGVSTGSSYAEAKS